LKDLKALRNYLVTEKNKLKWNTDKVIQITGKDFRKLIILVKANGIFQQRNITTL
jgi:hypothetical protein